MIRRRGYEDFMKAADAMKNASHEPLMTMGRGSLHHLKTGEILRSEPHSPKTESRRLTAWLTQ
jgi:hypothetical protein